MEAVVRLGTRYPEPDTGEISESRHKPNITLGILTGDAHVYQSDTDKLTAFTPHEGEPYGQS